MDSNKCLTYDEMKALIYDMIEKIPPTTNGIYIVDQDGKFYSTSDWNTSNNSKASGVAVVDPSASFIIAPIENSPAIRWGGYGIVIPNCKTSTSESTIRNDYAGESNTTAIINTLGVYGSAATATAMYIEEDIAAANNEAAAIPQTLSLEDDSESTNVFDSEEYSALLDKQAEGTLSEEEFARLSELDSLKIKQEFMEKYNIVNDTILYILLEKLRQRLKTNIVSVQSNSSEKYVDAEDVDKLSDTTIMRMILENDNTQAEEETIVYGADNSSDYAANCCRNYIFKHGKAGFLPAVGQLLVMYRLRSSINSALSLIGGTQLAADGTHWSSSQYDSNSAWFVTLGSGVVYDFGKNYTSYVRAICSFS